VQSLPERIGHSWQISASKVQVSSYRLIAITLALFSAAAAPGSRARQDQSPTVGQRAFAEKLRVPGVPDFGKVNDFL